MKSRHPFIPRRVRAENAESGQDSFLDIVSNIVGILIILVMIAGARVSSVQSGQSTSSNPAKMVQAKSETSAAEEVAEKDADNVSAEEINAYLAAAAKTSEVQKEIEKIRDETNKANYQLSLFRQQADGAERQHNEMILDISKIEAKIESEKQKKGEQEQKKLTREQELQALRHETAQLEKVKVTETASKPKAKQLENVPTPISQKVDGHEGYFCIRKQKISHVPVNVFAEQMKGTIRRIHDFHDKLYDETIGPIDGYRFHYQVSVEQFHHTDGSGYRFSFDFGEFLPVDKDLGETAADALKRGSLFERKLSIYLKNSSTITLFVYPDSYDALREIKKYLLQEGYVIALRPMPEDQPITISPNGTASVTY